MPVATATRVGPESCIVVSLRRDTVDMARRGYPDTKLMVHKCLLKGGRVSGIFQGKHGVVQGSLSQAT